MGSSDIKLTFNHIKSNFKWPKVKRKNIDHVRHYVDEENNIYHSVTRVVNDGKDFSEWYEKLAKMNNCSLEAGEAIGNYVKIQAGVNGTRVHKMCESYLNNEILASEGLLADAHFENLKHRLNKIDNIRHLEIQMFSPRMGLAGTADVIGEWGGKLSVIDFKTTKKSKPEEWIESYFLQSTAYALMYEENTGTPIHQIVIVFTGEDGSQDTYIKKTADYTDALYDKIEEFKSNTDVN